MFGVSREGQALSPPLFSVKQRLPWLQINLFTAFLSRRLARSGRVPGHRDTSRCL
jgi:Mg/Co/Ni transporter MgtE